MLHTTTIEINETEVEINIDFENEFGKPVINKITDAETGDSICPDLDETNISNELYNELCEVIADQETEYIPTENEYKN